MDRHVTEMLTTGLAARLAGRLATELDPLSHEPTVGIRVEAARVRVDMHTPDEGGITEADIDLAARLDVVAHSHTDVMSSFAG